MTVVPFAVEYLPVVARFAERYWSRLRTEEFYRWRYVDAAPLGRMMVGMGDGECLALVSALRKTYQFRGERVPVLEVFDWHCLPRWRGSGIGLRVMRAMMREPEPVLSIGGTADVLSTLPLMGWRKIATARMFNLPVSGRRYAESFRRRAGFAPPFAASLLGATVGGWFRPRPRAVPSGGRAIPLEAPDERIAALYRGSTGYGSVQIPEPEMFRWLSRGPGRFHVKVFEAAGGVTRGWTLARTYETTRGTEADLLEVFAPEPDLEIYTWLVSEAAASLLPFHPESIRARATCPLLQAALRKNRFREDSRDVPVHLWSPAGFEAPGPVHITLYHTDEPIRPHPGPDGRPPSTADRGISETR